MKLNKILKKTIKNKNNYISSNTLRSKKCYAGTDGIYYSCYNYKCLLKIARDWNNYIDMNIRYNNLIGGDESNKSEVLKIENKILNLESINKKDLWQAIDNINKKEFNCNTEYCWTTLPYIRNKSYLLKRFRPSKPKSWYKDKNTC